jgi:hypothetical protein
MRKATFVTLFALLLFASAAWGQGVQRPVRVWFKPGRTTEVLKGFVPIGRTARYVLNARGGQEMTIHVTSPRKDIDFSVYAPNENVAMEGARDMTDWTGTLPRSGDYWIVVANAGGTTRGDNYTLEVSIR